MIIQRQPPDRPARLLFGLGFFRGSERNMSCAQSLNPRQVSRVGLSPDLVGTASFFWTKKSLPMLDRLDLLRYYAYYFQFTLTPYGGDAEPYVPSKREVLIRPPAPVGHAGPGPRRLALRPDLSQPIA
jgi:hypothetical protein